MAERRSERLDQPRENVRRFTLPSWMTNEAFGLIFATWNPEAPSLDEQLGDMKYYMEAFLGRDPEGTTVVGGITKWVLKGNWKLAAEQFGTDWYHVNMSHASALMVLSPTKKKSEARVDAEAQKQARMAQRVADAEAEAKAEAEHRASHQSTTQTKKRRGPADNMDPDIDL